jgi:hypothetical protein
MRQGRGSLYLLTGVVIGFALGLAYVWVLHPATRGNVKPASMGQEYKDRYRALIAYAFLSNRDLVRARARLETLGDLNINQSLIDQAQRLEAQGGAADEMRALLMFLQALNQASNLSTPSSPDG